jgi:GNAT superfamily N-acetyltransferase
MTEIEYRKGVVPPREQVLSLYRANEWSSAEKPDALMAGLSGSTTLVAAWSGERLVGLANALSDGALVVYYPHLLVHPEFHRAGIGRGIMQIMSRIYADFHQQILVADSKAVQFYQSQGFEIAGKSRPMWIYDGDDHD